jgi:RHS repeat-associated protein
MELNGAKYYYVFNLQGDVVGLINDTGAKVVEYVYDSWGRLVSTTGSMASTAGVKNPYRYRGYRYDAEIGLYYLQSRYYDPSMKRFVNADGYVDTGNSVLSTNMFAYCENNPIMFSDSLGMMAIPSIKSIVKGVAGLAGFAWDNSQKIWYAKQNAWQRSLGYCDLYDTMAPLAGIDISHSKRPFTYNGKKWMIWLWKGRYGITTGAEVGIYIYSSTKSISYFGRTAKMKWYRAATDAEVKNFKVSMTLYKNGKKLFSRNTKGAWWITGFKMGMPSRRDSLKMKVTITFPSKDMANAFRRHRGWKTSNSSTVSFNW